jgi:integrase
MKMKKEHILPLSDTLVEMLKELKEIGISDNYLFPNTQHLNTHMSNNTVNHALRKMGFTKEEQTAHGMRAMFKTVCKENQEEHNLKNEFVERVLAHKTAGNVEEAYNRADNLKEMRFIVNWYSDYLDELQNG